MRPTLSLALFSILLSGCPDEKSALPPPPQPEEVKRTLEVKTATTATSTVTDEGDEPAEPIEAGAAGGIKKPPSCKAAPWSATKPCTKDAFAYVVAGVKNIQNPALARDTAANRGRKLLLELRGGGSEGTVNGAEIVQVAKCRRTTFALLRAPLAEVGKPALPACGGEVP